MTQQNLIRSTKAKLLSETMSNSYEIGSLIKKISKQINNIKLSLRFNNQFLSIHQPMDSGNQQLTFIVSENIAFQKKWLGIKHINYTLRGQIHNHEAAFRPTRAKRQLPIDGVQIIPILKKKDGTLQLIMIANFRPAIGKFCLEFPAGMVDDANFQQNARRQLRQETGYIAEKILKIPAIMMNCDPWKSQEGGFMYVGVINEEHSNHQGTQQLESAENIKVLTFKIDEKIIETIEQYLLQNNIGINTKLWTFIIGLSFHRFVQK